MTDQEPSLVLTVAVRGWDTAYNLTSRGRISSHHFQFVDGPATVVADDMCDRLGVTDFDARERMTRWVRSQVHIQAIDNQTEAERVVSRRDGDGHIWYRTARVYIGDVQHFLMRCPCGETKVQ